MAATEDAAITYRDEDDRYGYYACRRGSRALWLGFFDSLDGGVVLPTLAGRWVGFGVRACDKGDCIGKTVLRDLRTGRATRVGTEAADDRMHRVVVVSRAGWMAWTWTVFDPRRDRFERTAAEVHLLRADGRHQVLASGPDVDEESLALAGRRLYWTTGDEVESLVVA